MLRIGHKGADAIVAGNTLESFAAAVAAGADVVELDVLRPRADFPGGNWSRAPAGPAPSEHELVVAHDWGDAERRTPLTLDAALDAFTRPPLDRTRFDLDLKIRGREDELVAALRGRGLIDRAMASTMEVASLRWLLEHEPALERGWTLPRVGRDWSRSPWLRPLFLAGSASLRTRLPSIVRSRAPELGVWAVWVYHPLITRRLIETAGAVGVEVLAWTVDDAGRAAELAALGVGGIVSNDPRLLAGL